MTDYSVLSDAALAVAYGDGDNAAFDVLLRRCERRVYSYILFMVGDANVADDVFQDTFVKVLTTLRMGGYRPSGQFVAWVVRIAHNIIIDRYRACRRRGVVEGADDGARALSMVCDDDNRETRYCAEQTAAEVRALLAALPVSQREIVYMRVYEQLSFREIAAATGVSINTALGRMRYAVLNMRRMAAARHIEP